MPAHWPQHIGFTAQRSAGRKLHSTFFCCDCTFEFVSAVAEIAVLSMAWRSIAALQHFFFLIVIKREKEMKYVDIQYVKGFCVSKCRRAVKSSDTSK